MSSPASFYETGSAQPQTDDDENAEAEMPKRMMRVKVLYTFDDQNKTNCLARLPNPLSVPVIILDESTQIGVVELKTCIEAIVSASPELIAKLEHDYTVYAYDYSEYETPLVGQGMLSRVLASASPTPNAPASESRTMITGRVCKNIMGLFSNGVKETLEVKLKLVPVPSCSQTEYLKNMETYRNMTKPTLQVDPRHNIGSIEPLHDLLSQGQSPMEEDWNTTIVNPGSSRCGSPTPSHRSAIRGNEFSQSRPSSRMSMRQSQVDETNDDQNYEDGPVRKRARLTTTDWHGRGAFGGKSDSLRVAASTSGSLRDFRPSSHVTNSSAGGEQQPRAPTPRPFEKRATLQRTLSVGSGLRRQSSSMDNVSPYPPSEASTPRSDAVASPEDQMHLNGFSPQSPDLPSSPPGYAFHDESMPPSSPGLPELPFTANSDFQNENAHSLERAKVERSQTPLMTGAERAARERVRRQTERNKAQTTIAKKNSKAAWIMEQPGPTELLPEKQLVSFQNSRSHEKARNSAAGAILSKSQNSKEAPFHPTPLPTSEGVQYESTFNPDIQWHPPPPVHPTPPPSEGQLPAISADQRPSIPPSEAQPLMTNIGSQSAFTPSDIEQSSANTEIRVTPSSTSIELLDPRPTEMVTNGPTTGKIALPPRTTTQGVWTKQRAMPRAKYSTIDASSDVELDNVAESNVQNHKSSTSSKRGTANTRQKKRINDILQKDIAAGKAPRICFNCGDPSPATWRSLYVRTFSGSGTDIEVGTNGIQMVEPLEKNGQGEVISYRVYKQWTSLTDQEKQGGSSSVVQEYVMCNPCGNYVRQRGMHRPQQFWNRTQRQPGEKRKRSRPPKSTASQQMQPSSDFHVDSAPQFSSDYFQDLPSMLYTDPIPPQTNPSATVSQVTSTPAPAGSVHVNASQLTSQNGALDPGNVWHQTNWDQAAAATALRRAIQSSPARILGTQESPIEIDPDLTPKPTNRLLFPSPRKEGEFKSLEDVPQDNKNISIKDAQPSAAPANGSSATNKPVKPNESTELPEDNQTDKENLPPPIEDDDLAHLFEDFQPTTPGKPSPATANFIAALLKTPTPNSKRTHSTPRTRRSENSQNSHADDPLLNTPSRITRSVTRALKALTPAKSTPKHGTTTVDQSTLLTPMTAHLHKLLTDGIESPLRDMASDMSMPLDFSEYLDTTDLEFPMQGGSREIDWTDLPMPSSPPNLGASDSMIDFEFLGSEIPGGSEFGIWEDGSAGPAEVKEGEAVG
jgi:hypothetical protein